MKSFLERFYEGVRKEIGDPHASARVTDEELLEDLHDTDALVFDDLLKATGQESLLGYSEATITFRNGVGFYQLPDNFRQLLQIERRQSGKILDILRSKTFYEDGTGVEILTSTRGFRLFPAPSITADQEWILCYLRSPGRLHYARAGSIASKGLSTGTPPASGGELILLDDYYNGTEIRIYQAGNNAAPQVNTVTDFKRTSSGRGTFSLRYEWDPMPTGEIWYETLPTVPRKYESIYMLDVAMKVLERRGKIERLGSLIARRRRLWGHCKQHVISNVSDRPPQRTRPLQAKDYVATGEIPAW